MKGRLIWVFQLIGSSAFLAVLVWICYVILEKVWAGFSGLPDVAKVAVVGGIVTLSSVLVTRYYERRKEIEFRLRDRKLEAYSLFLDAWFDQLFSHDQELNSKIVDAMHQFGRDLILWGNTGVIKAYAAWRKNAGQGSALNSTRAFEVLLFAIRKDLGHNKWQLKQDDLSRVFINDVDEMKAKEKN